MKNNKVVFWEGGNIHFDPLSINEEPFYRWFTGTLVKSSSAVNDIKDYIGKNYIVILIISALTVPERSASDVIKMRINNHLSKHRGFMIDGLVVLQIASSFKMKMARLNAVAGAFEFVLNEKCLHYISREITKYEYLPEVREVKNKSLE